MPPEQQKSTKESLNDALNRLNFVVNAHATIVIPFIRCRFGAEALFPSAFFAFGALLLLTESRWKNGVGAYLVLWLMVMAYRRAETLARSWRGIVTHSRYTGDPWLAMRFRFIKTEDQGRAFEPVLCLFIGAGLYPIVPVVGLLVMAGFVSLGLKQLIDRFIVYRRVQQMRDAQIEGEYYAEEFKKGR